MKKCPICGKKLNKGAKGFACSKCPYENQKVITPKQ